MNKFITTLRTLTNAINPFYRNIIEAFPEGDHLNVDHLDPGAPHLATHRISKLLLANTNVHEAIQCLQGDHYLLRSVMTYNELRVNVYEIMPAPLRVDDPITSHSFLTGEPIKLLHFATTGHVHHVLSRIQDDKWQLEGQVSSAQTVSGYYEPSSPTASWIIALDNSDRRAMGLR